MPEFEFLKNAPEIIRAASQSNLGVLTLVILVLSITGVIFFSKARPNIRLLIFIMMFVGASILGIALLEQISQGSHPIRKAIPVYVNLVPIDKPLVPQDVAGDIASGQYSYDEQIANSNDVKTYTGRIEVTGGVTMGTWVVKLPDDVLDKAVELTLEDRGGNRWRVIRFYPNHPKQNYLRTSDPQPTSSLGHNMMTGVRFPTIGDAAVGKIVLVSLASDMEKHKEIKFDNYARPTREFGGRQYYEWRIFVDAQPDILEKIADVEYVLHPTFPDPVQVRSDPNKNFELVTTGWGGFTILITIRFKDNSILKTSYYLDLGKKWPH